MPVSLPFTGGCACGAIRYECAAEPLRAGHCHCRDCQRESGSAFTSNLTVPQAALTITQGTPKYHGAKADSGNSLRRWFCPACGSPLFARPLTMPDIMGIRAGSLDDPSWFAPERDIWTASAQPWDYLNPALPKFPHMPR